MLTFSVMPHRGEASLFVLTRRTVIEFQISTAKLQKKIEICNLFPLKKGVKGRLKLKYNNMSAVFLPSFFSFLLARLPCFFYLCILNWHPPIFTEIPFFKQKHNHYSYDRATIENDFGGRFVFQWKDFEEDLLCLVESTT